MVVLEKEKTAMTDDKGQGNDTPGGNPPDLLLKPPQVARMLGIHPQTVLEWLRAGTLPGIRLPGNAGWRVRKSDLEAWLDRRATGQDQDQDAE